MITVTALNRMVRAAIRRDLPGTLHVVGELSNLSRPSGGHLYFTLKDDASEVRGVMWQSAAASLKFQPLDGLAVIATGTIDVYEPRGQYQLLVRKLEPRGVGALELAFRQLRERLQKEGLFDPQRKRKLPRYPARIAVVTSPTGAAIHDILQTLERRFPCVEIFVYPVRVQGDGAATEIADAIRRINAASLRLGGIDVMIVGRGGGSIEDLWAFNEEVVARAIHASAIPVVSAVGHEVDITIADLVADVRAATPTAAAELVVPQLGDVLMELDVRRNRLVRASLGRLDAARNRLSLVRRYQWFCDPVSQVRLTQQRVDEAQGRLRLAASRRMATGTKALHELEVRLLRVRPEAVITKRREVLATAQERLRRAFAQYARGVERRINRRMLELVDASPRRRIEKSALHVDQLSGRLGGSMSRAIESRLRTLAVMEDRLRANSHEAVLKRGFTITRRVADGLVIRSAGDARKDDLLSTRTSDGEVRSRTE
ncbi:MAG TPA: exodeoxyribonuclease VII large subunit [Phycisphaerae bacterium]|nr:exodeoxyribonuclease VII large subunit [Phycisphaerae bacterium]